MQPGDDRQVGSPKREQDRSCVLRRERFLSPRPQHDTRSLAAIVGGVVGSLGGLALVLLAIYLVCRRRARAIQPPPQIGFDSAYGDKSTYGDPASMTHAQMVALSYQGQQAGGSPLERGRQTPLVPYFSPQGEAASSFDSPVRAGTAPELVRPSDSEKRGSATGNSGLRPRRCRWTSPPTTAERPRHPLRTSYLTLRG